VSNVETWSTTAAGNSSNPPDGAPEGTSPGTKPEDLNAILREIMAAVARWHADMEFLNLSYGYTVSRVSASVVRIAGVDQTAIFQVGARFMIEGGAAPQYGFVASRTFTGGNTDITVTLDGGASVDAATNKIRCHIARSIRNVAFRYLGTATGEVPLVENIKTLAARERDHRVKTTADQSITATGTTGITLDGATNYIAIPNANGLRDYVFSALLAMQRTATTGTLDFTFQIHKGTNGTSADAVIYSVAVETVAENDYLILAVNNLAIDNPASGQRLSFSLLKSLGAAGVGFSVFGSNGGAKTSFSFFAIEEKL
jgi:hypothetical protein